MEELNRKFSLLGESLTPKKAYENDEIFPSLKLNFKSDQCERPFDFEILPYRTGFALSNLYKKNDYISTDLLISKGAASWPKSSKNSVLALDRVPAIYGKVTSYNCSKDYLLVFGIGEIQPGRVQCQISGLWEITYID